MRGGCKSAKMLKIVCEPLMSVILDKKENIQKITGTKQITASLACNIGRIALMFRGFSRLLLSIRLDLVA